MGIDRLGFYDVDQVKDFLSPGGAGSLSTVYETVIPGGTTAQYWRGDKTWQTLNKAAVGLGNVDNTADSAKNVLSATKLTTSRTLAATGDVTWTGSFDGSANFSVTSTIAANAVTFSKLVAATQKALVGANAAGNFQEITLGSGLALTAGVLTASGSGGTVTTVTGTAPIASSGGATPDISITAASGAAAGSMSAADYTKLSGIATGATANSTDAYLLARANHTGTQAGSTVTGVYTAAGMTMATARLLGRTTAASGAAEEISVGSGLTLTAGVLDRVTQTTVSGNAGTATALQTARTIDGQSFDGSANITVIAPGTHAATSKTTPVDADELPLVDSAASNVLKKLTWANLKATAKTYFDTLYVSISGALGTPSSGTLTNCTGLPIAGLTASTATAIGVGSIELGHASDTTISRAASGDINIEGNRVYRAGGTTVAVLDGGTGVTTKTGTGNVVLSASPTLTGTFLAAAGTLSGHLRSAGASVSGQTNFGSGKSAEFGYAGSSFGAFFQGYDRDATAYLPTHVDGLVVNLDHAGVNKLKTASGGVIITGESQSDSLRINAAPTVAVAQAVTHKLAVNLNGTTYYLLLSNV